MSYVFFVEGETEEKLVQGLHLKGRIKIANLWQNPVEKIVRTLGSQHKVIIIYDTDRIENIKRFIRNLEILNESKCLYAIVQQTNNLEDELAYACGKNKPMLFRLFDVSTAKEFKGSFMKYNNAVQKLLDNGFDPDKLWVKELIKELNDFQKLKKDYRQLQKMK